MDSEIIVKARISQKVNYGGKVHGQTTHYFTLHEYPQWAKEGLDLTIHSDNEFSLSPLSLDTPPKNERKGHFQGKRLILNLPTHMEAGSYLLNEEVSNSEFLFYSKKF